MRQIKKIIGGMLCCVLITGLFSVPVDASKKKAATTDTETTETDTTKQDDKHNYNACNKQCKTKRR